MAGSLRRSASEPALARLIPRHQQEAFAIHAGMPGFEVHVDPDITWMIQDGPVWSNAGVELRFQPATVGARLDEIAARFRRERVGVGFWVDPEATPGDLERHLGRRGFHCRKYFPGMAADLAGLPEVPVPEGISFRAVADHDIFRRYAHPAYGPMTTPLRRRRVENATELWRRFPNRVFDFVAEDRVGRPVGACTLLLSKAAVGFHDVGVLEDHRRRGIAAALLLHCMAFARARGWRHAVLLATGMGFNVYKRVGFREVCRVGYWYRSGRRD